MMSDIQIAVKQIRAICVQNNIKKFYYNINKKGELTLEVELRDDITT